MLKKSFIYRWQNCRECSLCELTRNHVIGWGSIPADVVFIGEAPGPIEDILGRPLVGPAGKLFREMLAEAAEIENYDARNGKCQLAASAWDMLSLRLPFSFYVTNVVACAPWTDDRRKEFRAPTDDEAEKCSPRLNTIIEEAKPKTIVLVGSVSKKAVKIPRDIPVLSIVHPAAILRMNVPPVNTVPYHRAVHQLRDHFKEVLSV